MLGGTSDSKRREDLTEKLSRKLNRQWIWTNDKKKTGINGVQSEIANHVKTLYDHDSFLIINA